MKFDKGQSVARWAFSTTQQVGGTGQRAFSLGEQVTNLACGPKCIAIWTPAEFGVTEAAVHTELESRSDGKCCSRK